MPTSSAQREITLTDKVRLIQWLYPELFEEALDKLTEESNNGK